MHRYDLPLSSESMRRSAAAWLLLGLIAQLGAGLYSILLALAGIPAVHGLVSVAGFFDAALVVQVELSVPVWLLAMAGMLWSLGAQRDMPAWDRLSFWMAAGGTVIVILAPFLGADRPVRNNYVAILQHPVFYTGVGLFAAGIVSHLLRYLFSLRRAAARDGATALRFGITLSVVLTVIAILSFMASRLGIPPEVGGPRYFDFLFWGGGHVLQFTYTLLMMVAWVVLASAGNCRFDLSPRQTSALLAFVALPVVCVPVLYLAYDVVSPGHRLAFTQLMKYGGLSSLPLGLAVLLSWRRAGRAAGEQRYLRSALGASMVLFAAGGLLGFIRSGLDVAIPAHFHGSTVGVTLGLMGLAYYLLPRLGWGALPARMTFWQPLIYGGGQLIHIVGLALAGGGGDAETASAGETAGMLLMGLGGLASVVGGLLFLFVAYRSIASRPRPSAGDRGTNTGESSR